MSHRRPLRLDAEGPTTVSVADSSRDARAYNLYIKTPTHNLTLTRTALEIIDLDTKLRESNAKVPKLPIEPGSIPIPKRKSTFLNTLSRLASPTSAKSGRKMNRSSPAASPSNELNDPFTDITEDDAASMVIPSPTATSTAIAAYLTTISNTPALRTSRPWKRFTRVRTDDLESVRVERAIKRVRSDLAAHVGGSKDKENFTTPPVPPLPEKPSLEQQQQQQQKLQPKEVNGLPPSSTTAEKDDQQEVSPDQKTEDGSVEESKPEPVSSTAATDDSVSPAPVSTRLHRSKSVDADRSSDRLSRSFVSSSSQNDGGTSSAASITGEESSSAGIRDRKKKKKKEKVARPSDRKVNITDFEMMRVLGKGCAGKVLLVRHKKSTDLYALKAITKRHVLAHQELQHTLTEQAVLKRMAAANKDPFVVKLWWSFHDKENLFLVMDFHPGGDLATQLARWGRLGRDRARFYAAEIVEGVEGLHNAGVIYRDLKPENILIGGDGHIVLTDFGLSKEFPKRMDSLTAPPTPRGGKSGDFYSDTTGPNGLPATPPWMKPDKNGDVASGWPALSSKDTTTTFCGTAEYLAPEVIQGQPYSYEVDWWSFGTMLFEMLTGITPFWANNHSDMYVRVLQDELHFPDDRALDQDTKSLVRGLLQRNPSLRICEPRIKKHPYFSMIDWSHVYYKRYIPPYIPPIDPSNASDTQNFDDTFLDMEPVLDDADEDEEDEDGRETDHTSGSRTEDESDAVENKTPSQSRKPSLQGANQKEEEEETVDVFDGYSFKGRHSVLIDDDEGSEEGSSEGSEISEGSQDITGRSDEVLDHVRRASEKLGALIDEEEEEEPKTPEARPHAALPAEDVVTEEKRDEETSPPEVPVKPAHAKSPSEHVSVHDDPKTRKSKELPRPAPADQAAPAVPTKDGVKSSKPARHSRQIRKKEKSGVAALDQYLSDDTADEDEGGARTERDDDEDDDWDLIDASNIDGEEKNGGKGTTLFARGVVDKYKLAVAGFGRNRTSTPGRERGSRSVSGTTLATDGPDSPTPSAPSTPGSIKKRSKNQGYSFRKNPRQFLRPRSPPPSSFSSLSTRGKKGEVSSNGSSSMTASGSLSGSASGSLTQDTSVPSLKTKDSTISRISGHSSGGGAGVLSDGELSASPETERTKGKKLKRVKENAEKVFSIFSSPRPQPANGVGRDASQKE